MQHSRGGLILEKMNPTSKTRFSLAVLLLASWACLAHPEDEMEPSASASRLTPLRLRRVVGGMVTQNVPWQAMVYLNESILDGGFAGGALVSDRWVLTAGRNLFIRKDRQGISGSDPLIPKVYLGISDRSEADALHEFAVEKVVLHPRFQNRSDWDNDLALIQLKEPVAINDKVTPIPLPKGDTNFESGVITGWGWGVYKIPAQVLKYIRVPLVQHSVCKAAYKSDHTKPGVDDNMFCTGQTNHEENVCFGDAGGALAVSETGDIYAAGILSYDKVCRPTSYAVYMKISSYLPWIHSVMRGDTEKSAALRANVMSKFL
ncbi:LOW QUALITY PROTEIN: haptoglobin [Brachionichthys hirsutus]|uniref:LOW QUALITY PROTEIN: haptoglobin n=1 Tax=Brachionichthys hirsutus TaxID=412623 RepID=UPI003604DBBE